MPLGVVDILECVEGIMKFALGNLFAKLSRRSLEPVSPSITSYIEAGASTAEISVVDNGIVAPVSRYVKPGINADGSPCKGEFDGGLYDRQGKRLNIGDNAYLGHVNAAVQTVATEGLKRFPGQYLYLGMVQNVHFGHFTSESLSRIWGADLVKDVDGVIYIPRYPNQPLRPYVTTFLEALLPDANFVRPEGISQYERIIVPAALRFAPGYMKGGSMVRSFFHQRTQTPALTDKATPKRLFVSRSQFRLNAAQNKACFVCETKIDELMQAEGYTVFYPEQHSPEEQFRHYNNADELVFAEGSSFHVYVLTARPGQKVYCLWRRKTMHPVFENQLKSFSGERLRGATQVKKMYYRRDAPTVIPWALSELDFDGLRDDLIREGMISGTAWASPEPKEIEAELAHHRNVYDLEHPF